jgi:hypothetical protein
MTAVWRGRALPYDTGGVARRDGGWDLRGWIRPESSPNGDTMLKGASAREDAALVCNFERLGVVELLDEG